MCKWSKEKVIECPVIGPNLIDNSVHGDRHLQIKPDDIKSERKCQILPHMDKSSNGISSWECSNHTNDSSICLKKCQNDPESVEGLGLKFNK